MKNSIALLALTAALFSCKKEETPAFTPTNTTGTSVVSGNVSKNVITPNGNGSWTNNTRIPAAGVNVSIKVNKSALYPNSTAQGADVYTATTDNNGNYSISVKTNATGVPAMISIDGFSSTLDTLINGTKKTGLNATFQGLTQTTTLYMGQNLQLNHNFNGNTTSSNPNNIMIGSAIVTGSVSMSFMKETSTNNFSPVNVAVPLGTTVYMTLNKDPYTLSPKTYTTATDASGYYTFNVATVDASTPNFAQNATLWINDLALTRDTLKLNNSIVPGRAGVFQMANTAEGSIYSGTIRNAVVLRYMSFVPN